ncbi:MAG: DUF4423 domain-containing protein [Oligoflexales bacterium]
MSFHLAQYDTYKSAIKAVLLNKKEKVSKRYTFEKMALASGLQKTYLSRVLNGDSHLNKDQLYCSCEYLGLVPTEKKYIELLHDYETTQNPGRKAEVLHLIQNCRKQLNEPSAQIDAKSIVEADSHNDEKDLARYYLDPKIRLVHTLLGLEKYSKNINLVAKDLSLDTAEVLRIVTQLERMRLVKLEENGYASTERRLHLNRENHLYKANRSLQRLNALERMNSLPDEKCFNFNVIFSADPEARAKIREKLLELVNLCQKVVEKSEKKEVYQLSIDLFDWT